MSRLDLLPPDQRAALTLLLSRRKSYGEVASMLGIGERAVHDRAHAALAVLAPTQARGIAPGARLEVGDYVLGQQPSVADRLRTRSLLGSSEPARAWAQALAAELAPLAPDGVADIPAAAVAAPAAVADPGGLRERLAAAQPQATPGAETGAGQLPASRLGGALLLGAIVLVVALGIVLLATRGGSSHSSTTTSSTSTSTAAAKKGPKIVDRVAMLPPDPASRSVGLLYVLQEGTKQGFYIAAEHLPPSKRDVYILWLYNSPTSFKGLSAAPAVGASEKLAGGALLPSNASSFRYILLTRETNHAPTHPGHLVLRGELKLPG